MQHVIMRTESGSYLTPSADGAIVGKSGATPGPESVFTIEQNGSELVRLRLGNGERYLTNPGSGGGTVFLGDRAQAVALRLQQEANGRYSLSTDEGELLLDNGRLELLPQPSPGFALEDRSDPIPWAAALTNCCGTDRNEAGITWNDLRHQDILEKAISTIEAHKASPVIGKYAQAMSTFWKNNKTKIQSGLTQADEDMEYRGGIFEKHFYDPDSRNTILLGSKTNAMTECLRYFYRSANNRDTSPDSAAFDLGLGLHYFTDLTQPMHAANFANVLPGLSLFDLRHMGFENYADSETVTKELTAKRPKSIAEAELDPALWESPGQMIDQVARYSRAIFTSQIEHEAKRRIVGFGFFVTIWGSEVHSALVDSILNAEKMTAAFLLWWAAHNLRQSLDRVYARLLAPQRPIDDSGFATWGGRLLDGGTMQSVVLDVSLSPEARGGIVGTSDEKVRKLYRRLLARDPDPTAFQAWGGLLQQPDGYDAVVKGIVQSAEYDKRFGPYVLPAEGYRLFA